MVHCWRLSLSLSLSFSLFLLFLYVILLVLSLSLSLCLSLPYPCPYACPHPCPILILILTLVLLVPLLQSTFIFGGVGGADELIVAIADDIKFAKEKFKDPAVIALATEDPFWTEVTER